MMKEPRLPPLPATTLPLLADTRTMGPLGAMRLHLLRIAADTAPRLTGGVKVEEVVARARAMELYVLGLPPGSEGAEIGAASGEDGTERGAPEPAPQQAGDSPASAEAG